MRSKLKKYLTQSTHRKLKVKKENAKFRLMLGELKVGVLRYLEGKWLFAYSEEFKQATGIKSIADFPDLNEEYVSEELWPFFSSRIPSLSRERVKNVIHREGTKEDDLLSLLALFGQKTITNPFELLSVEGTCSSAFSSQQTKNWSSHPVVISLLKPSISCKYTCSNTST